MKNNIKAILHSFDAFNRNGSYDIHCESMVISVLVYIKFMQDVFDHPEKYPNKQEVESLLNKMQSKESVLSKWRAKFNSFETILWNKLKSYPKDVIGQNIKENIANDFAGCDRYRIKYPEIESDIYSLIIEYIDSLHVDSCDEVNELYELVCANLNTMCAEKYHHFLDILYRHMSSFFSFKCVGNCIADEYGAKYSIDGKYLIKVPNIQEYVVREGTLHISDYCFYEDADLERVILPKSLETIGHCAFYLCHKLQDIVIDNQIKYIGSGAFNSCYNLNISLNNSLYRCYNKLLLSSDGKKVLSYWGMDEEIIIPEGVEVLTRDSLRNANYTKKINLPCTLEVIQANALVGYKGEFCTIPPMVRHIGSMAFGFSKKLLSINFPGNCYVFPDALHKCYKLKTIYLSGRNVLLDPSFLYYCKSLEAIYVIENDINHYHDVLDSQVSKYIRYLSIN